MTLIRRSPSAARTASMSRATAAESVRVNSPVPSAAAHRVKASRRSAACRSKSARSRGSLIRGAAATEHDSGRSVMAFW
jgi:hypothetical protein